MKKQKNVAITNRVIPNLIWNLQRLPLSFLNNLRGRFRIKYKMTSLYKDAVLNKDDFRAPLRSGFTLIELLIVVLIIGILAAIALPQYQKAVTKARFAEAGLVLNALWKERSLYILEKGSWIDVGFDNLTHINIQGKDVVFWGKEAKQTDYFVYHLIGVDDLPVAYYNPKKLGVLPEDPFEMPACLYLDEGGNIACSYMGEENEKICKYSGYPVGGEDNGYCW